MHDLDCLTQNKVITSREPHCVNRDGCQSNRTMMEGDGVGGQQISKGKT
jgi:hypothetical protein